MSMMIPRGDEPELRNAPLAVRLAIAVINRLLYFMTSLSPGAQEKAIDEIHDARKTVEQWEQERGNRNE